MNVRVLVAKIKYVRTVFGFGFGNFFRLAVSGGGKFQSAFAFGGKVFAVLVGVWNRASNAVVLVSVWEDGGHGFFDVHFRGAVFGAI